MSLKKQSMLNSVRDYRTETHGLYPIDIYQVSIYNGAVNEYESAIVYHRDLVNSFPLKTIELIDEDDMASNSLNHIPTQQSVKSYIDSKSSKPSNLPIHDLSNNTTYTNNTGFMLIIVAYGYSTNDLGLYGYIGETENSTSAEKQVSAVDLVSIGKNATYGNITFVVPRGYKYRLHVHSGYGGSPTVQLKLAQAWEI